MSGLLPVAEAQARLLALARPTDGETLPAEAAAHRFAAADVLARRDQPVADLSSMDGYAIRYADMPGPWRQAGISAAGKPYDTALAPGEAVRIFTGAALPADSDTIIVQEDVEKRADVIHLSGSGPSRRGEFVRHKAFDFAAGDRLIAKGERITPARLALAITGGHGAFTVGCRPKVAILSTGDELVPPGALAPGAMLPASNGAMLAAMLAAEPCVSEDRGIFADDLDTLTEAFGAARDDGADIIVTSGGASVGDHDLVRPALERAGASIDFWRIAMKPGRPLMAGRLGNAVVLGLPGNPASAFVTTHLFLLPLVRHMAGAADPMPEVRWARLAEPLTATGSRDDYLRARFDGRHLTALGLQDSGALTSLAAANCLIRRAAGSPPAEIGTAVEILVVA